MALILPETQRELLRTELARLYWDTGTVQFGEFRLAAHQADPDLPPSPFYMHYPVDGSHADKLERLHEVAATLMLDLIEREGLTYDRLGAVPKGAEPIAKSMIEKLAQDRLLVRFRKTVEGGQNRFGLSYGRYDSGDSLLGIEDHTSGGHNKRLFIEGAARAGLRVRCFVTVVDRQQGAANYLGTQRIGFYSLFTLSQLLNLYREWGLIDLATVRRVRTYLAENQLWTPTAA